MSLDSYETPNSPDNATSTSPASGVSGQIVADLRKTRPWILLIAVSSFICVGLFALSALTFLFIAPLTTVVSVLIAGLAAIPGFFLVRYAGAIKRVLDGGGVWTLEEAITAQASFWKVAGIFTLVTIALTPFEIMNTIEEIRAFLEVSGV